MSPVVLLKVTLSTFPALTSCTSSENCGCAPCGFVPLKTAHTRTTRHKIISHKTALRTLEFMKTSPKLLLRKTLQRSLRFFYQIPNPEHRSWPVPCGELLSRSKLPSPQDFTLTFKDRPGGPPPGGNSGV